MVNEGLGIELESWCILLHRVPVVGVTFGRSSLGVIMPAWYADFKIKVIIFLVALLAAEDPSLLVGI